MILTKEEHRQLLKAAVMHLPVSGPAGSADMLNTIHMVHELLKEIDEAQVDGGSVVEMMRGR